MEKSKIVELVRGFILGAESVDDNAGKIHWKRIDLACGFAWENLLNAVYETQGDTGIEGYYVKHYYKQKLYKDTNKLKYAYPPVDIVPLPSNKGIWYVQPSGGGSSFVRFDRPTKSLFDSLPVGEATKDVFFRYGNVEGVVDKRIIVEDTNDGIRGGILEVDFGLVPTWESYGDNENITMPKSDFDTFVKLVATWFGKVYNDKTNNNQ
jgi:hypothetical protein